MPNKPLPEHLLREAYDAIKAAGGGRREAGRALGMNRETLAHRYREAVDRLGLPPIEPKIRANREEPNTAPLPSRARALDPTEDQRMLALRAENARLKKAYNDFVRDRAEEERLVRLFESAIHRLPTIPGNHFRARLTSAKPRKGPRKPETPILLRSDQQIGEEITFEETFGINHYNFEVFQQRLEALEERTLDILTDHQRADFPILAVPYLGDNISGRIHVELQKYGHQHVIDQIYLGAAAEALFLYRLLKFGRWNQIIVPCVSGNHGRLDKEKEVKRYYKNFDYLFVSIMATFLRGVPQIRFHIPQCLFTMLDVADHRVLLSHGHELPPSSLGIPLYSINRASASYQELIAMSGSQRFQYWFLGHYHRTLELDGSFVNGTMAGLSELGIGRFKPILPIQRLLGFHPKWGRAWEYPVRLDRVRDERRVYLFESAMATPDALEVFAEGTRRADKDAA